MCLWLAVTLITFKKYFFIRQFNGFTKYLTKTKYCWMFFQKICFPPIDNCSSFLKQYLNNAFGLWTGTTLLVRVMCSIDLPTNKTVTTSKLVPFCCSTKQGHTACQIKLFSNYKRYRDVEARKKKDTDKRMIWVHDASVRGVVAATIKQQQTA